MNYREIIEEQIMFLQEKQEKDEVTNLPEEACKIAETIADLASRIKSVPEKFVPEDSNGVCKGGKSCKCPKKEAAPEGQVQEQPEILGENYDGNTIFQMKDDMGAIFQKYNLSYVEAKSLLRIVSQVIDKVSSNARLWNPRC
ncbi:hypothetical protein AB8U03_17870 [Clostridium sp. Mt-5]|uniref:Uncharacterized protein n=1 Tax=Clostridium moutaii TaxID=3240932 RepID=A0ABV4BTA0_9CLOT